MRQMLLDLGAEKPQTLDTFVVGHNAELSQLLRRFSQYASGMPGERFVYLWGEAGAGKSHLLHALAAVPGARYIPAGADDSEYLFDEGTRLYLMDDCQLLSPDAQISAFALFNQVRENDALLVSAGDKPPAGLALREDLRTRLGWGLIYQLHGLTDDEKIAALTQAAQARGITLSPGVLPYLITHFRRDMRSLSSMLDALDQYSLETQRPITLPLLRSLLQLEGEPKSQ
ncbi:DnaA regulatory inactivator Hda [Noviherbaspirillum denitrificans]|uniref:DnaA regulatory inactivator Hda n=1 Tax=Noviherbaspirillum denitrificans TaxID=1968433 RepID=A0A254TGZ0_9BURK|nr:DnaA regulatory inactivator Hda [Noviherbaspirillum denitrificans]OWW21795.1 DnaA regulatory inactivator Hda [Noviherbaspirillum denitrificans]